MTLKLCPECNGDVYPHCLPHDPRTYSETCDLVVCIRCGARGSLDGRWWPSSSSFLKLRRAIDRLRADIDEGGQRDR